MFFVEELTEKVIFDTEDRLEGFQFSVTHDTFSFLLIDRFTGFMLHLFLRFENLQTIAVDQSRIYFSVSSIQDHQKDF